MKKTIWALFDDRMGSVGQIKGIIQALDEKKYLIVEKKIVYNKLAKLPNLLKGISLTGVTKESKEGIKVPWPDLVISGSRRTAPIARWIKKQSKGMSKIVQLMHPGSQGLKDFDLVFVSEHDRHKTAYDNFVYLIGVPHRINEKTLREAKKKWAKTFKPFPKPWTMVIVGGAIKGEPFPLENAVNLAHLIRKFKEQTGGSIFFTNSRRTGVEADKILLETIKEFPNYSYLWGSREENPIMGFWASADQIIVTGDSVSMCSESCGVGKPVLIFEDTWLTKKHHRFVNSLIEGGYATSLADPGALEFEQKQKLDPSAVVAEKIDALFRL